MLPPLRHQFDDKYKQVNIDYWLCQIAKQAHAGNRRKKAELALIHRVIGAAINQFLPSTMKLHVAKDLSMFLQRGDNPPQHWIAQGTGLRNVLHLLLAMLRQVVTAIAALRASKFPLSGQQQDIVEVAGVVMIDDVESHLHPSLLRLLRFWLKRHFPCVQFLVTTHSPLICQAADSNGLFVLSDGIIRAFGNHERI